MGINFIDTGLAESAHQVVKTFISGGAFAAGELVELDMDASDGDRCITVEQANATGLVVGVALEASTAAGQRIRVAVKGYVEAALTDNSLTAGNSFASDASGLCKLYAGSEAYQPVGVALEADAGTNPYYADVYLFGLFA